MCGPFFPLRGSKCCNHQGLYCDLDIRSEQIQMLPSPLKMTYQTGYPGAEDNTGMLISWSRQSRRWAEMYFRSLQFSDQHS